jgi:hypothetical protein
MFVSGESEPRELSTFRTGDGHGHDRRLNGLKGAGVARVHHLNRTTRALASTAIAAICLLGCGGGTPGSRDEPRTPATAQGAVEAEPADLQALVGRWQRTDGGYVLEIRSVAGDGSLDAAYFNPNPINVSLAQASDWRGAAALVVEFDDVNYRGSTYELVHQPDRDLLVGTYYQAALEQIFEVVFVRIQ